MALPGFYTSNLFENNTSLDEATSRHIVQVLRMQPGEQVQLTDGLGKLAIAEIIEANKKQCSISIVSITETPKNNFQTAIAISPIKNAGRFEWFLEKATELGISNIYTLLCQRTEKEHFRYERMNAICISAMLQSKQCWLPILHQPIDFKQFVQEKEEYANKWIAHCENDGEKHTLVSRLINAACNTSSLILIGPEGDFTREEINLAQQNSFAPVALGNTRLRTETAGVVAATLLQMLKN